MGFIWRFFPWLSISMNLLALTFYAVVACLSMAYVFKIANVLKGGDVAAANAAFAVACAELPRVLPLAVVNPCLSDWPETLRTIPANAAGVFVSPYLHDWCLADATAREFFDVCADRGATVFVNCALSDHRFRHADAVFRPVTDDELMQMLSRLSRRASIVFQGLEPGTVRRLLAQSPADDCTGPSCRVEISRLTDKGTHLADIVADYGTDRLVLGSEFPFRHPSEVRWAAGKLMKDS